MLRFSRLLILFSFTLFYQECQLLSVIYYKTSTINGCRSSCETTDTPGVQYWSLKAGLNLSSVLENGSNISIEVHQPNSSLNQSLCSMTISGECGLSPNGTCCSVVSKDEKILIVTANLTLSCLNRRGPKWELSLAIDSFSVGSERLDITEYFFTGLNIQSNLTINKKVINETNCIAHVPYTDIDIDYTCDNQPDTSSCQLEIIDCFSNMTANSSSNERVNLLQKYLEHSQVYFVLKKRARHERNETHTAFVCKVVTGYYSSTNDIHLNVTIYLFAIGSGLLLFVVLYNYRYFFFRPLKKYKLIYQENFAQSMYPQNGR